MATATWQMNPDREKKTAPETWAKPSPDLREESFGAEQRSRLSPIIRRRKQELPSLPSPETPEAAPRLEEGDRRFMKFLAASIAATLYTASAPALLGLAEKVSTLYPQNWILGGAVATVAVSSVIIGPAVALGCGMGALFSREEAPFTDPDLGKLLSSLIRRGRNNKK